MKKIPDVTCGGRSIPVGSEFPGRLRKLRERKQMSRRALSELCGLSKNVISMYERGEKEPAASSLEKLADFFDMTMDDLWKNF